ncbi:MAG: orotidine-5'-phosphate decarboxylase [Nitrospiria bacterium]
MSARPTSAKERIILPLDFDSLDQAAGVIRKLKDHIGLFKVGLTLFVKEGPLIMATLEDEVGGDKVFFDLKFHDTPNTVRNASSAITSRFPVRFVTVHASAGERILRAAVDAMQGRSKVLAVTVLTSTSEKDSEASGDSLSVKDRVLRCAETAKRAGCGGVVCSAQEAGAVKEKCGGDFIVVTPGIRPSSLPVTEDDQQRIMTPGEAIKNGADYLVIGRPIYRAGDPVDAAKKVAEEIQEAIEQSS